MSKALKWVYEPHETEYRDPITNRQPWKLIRKWEAGAKPSDIFKSDLDLLPWRKQKQIERTDEK